MEIRPNFSPVSKLDGILVVFPHQEYWLPTDVASFAATYQGYLDAAEFQTCQPDESGCCFGLTSEMVREAASEIMVVRLRTEMVRYGAEKRTETVPISRELFRRDAEMLNLAYRTVLRYLPGHTANAVAVTAAILGIPALQVDAARRRAEGFDRIFG